MKTLMVILLVLALICLLVFIFCILWALFDDLKQTRKRSNGIPLTKEEWRKIL